MAGPIIVFNPPKDTPFTVNGRVTSPWLAFFSSLSALGVVVQTLTADSAAGGSGSSGGATSSLVQEIGTLVEALNADSAAGGSDLSGAMSSGLDELTAMLAGASSSDSTALRYLADDLGGQMVAGLNLGALLDRTEDLDGRLAAGANLGAFLDRLADLEARMAAGDPAPFSALGSAAFNDSSAFDAAGAAAAAIAALLAGSNTWNGATQTINSNVTIWSTLTLGYAMSWAGAQIFGTAKFSNDMLFPFSNGFWYASANASSWYEFRSITSQGATLGQDYFGSQYNSRPNAGSADSWHDVSQIAALTGALTFFTAVTLNLAPVFGDAAGTRANLGLGTAATQASTAFDAAGAAATAQAAAIAASNQRASNLSDVASVATARTNLGLGTAAVQNMASLGAATLAGTLTLNGQSINGSTNGSFNIGRNSAFASNGVAWALNILNAAAGDNLALGQTGAAYTTGGSIGWAGNSNAYLYFNSGQDFRIGAGVGATPAITIKGGTRNVILAGSTDNAVDVLQVNGSASVTTQVKTAGLTTGIRTVTAADTATTSDHTILGNISGAVTETLPAAPLTGQEFYLVNIGSAVWTIAGNGKNIWAAGASAASITLAANASAILQYDGALWRRIL